jgi:putative ABC transport system permease protein
MVGLSRTLLRASGGYLLRHPWGLWLSVLGIGLGVAVVIAVDLANQSARNAFRLSMEAVTGRATHQIVGGPAGVPEQTYRDLRLAGGHWPSAPVVEGRVQGRSRTFTLLGLDPLAEKPFREGMAQIGDDALKRLLLEPATLMLPEAMAQELDIGVGESLELTAGGIDTWAEVVGLFASDNPAARDGLLLADIATAQELLARTGVLDRIDLILTPSQVPRVRALLPPGLRLERASSRTESSVRMTQAFHTNLAAMSLLALLVGGFIIYNGMTFSVLQRRALLGHLRVLGVTRRELFILILGEALALGIAGSLLGLLAGSLIAQGLVQLVTRTINDLYFSLTVSRLLVNPEVLLEGALVGMGASLAAALVPALEAARSEPRDVQRRTGIEHSSGRLVHGGAAIGLLLLTAGLALARLPWQDLTLAFTALFLVIAGFSLTVPLLLAWCGPLLHALLGRLMPPLGRLAVRGITRSLSRTGPALAALTVAVSATVGVGIMIESFRGTVDLWLEQTLTSDIYISTAAGISNRAAGALPPSVLERVRALPGIRDVSQGRRVRIRAEHGEVELLAIRMASHSYRGFRFKGPTEPRLWNRFNGGELILASEPYAYRHGLAAGDGLRLLSAAGWRDYRIGGVFFDYGNDQGMLVMAQPHYSAYWDDPGVSALGVGLQDPTLLQPALAAIRNALAPLEAALRIRATGELRRHSMDVFDRTFAITRVLRLLAVGVAFIGILSALLALNLERARDHAVLRAIGATPGQILGLVILQSGLLGLLAGLLALPLGWLMSNLLIDVINLRSFGWSMQKLLPFDVLLQAVGLALLSALLAGLYPAWRASRSCPADALRSE